MTAQRTTATRPHPATRDPRHVRAVVRAALAARHVEQAAEIADVLVEASLTGVHTHGVRLLADYLDELDRGVAVARANLRVLRDTGAVALLDAGASLGVVAALHATGLAVERAQRTGVGVVGVRNSNHFGAAGVYARRIARAGMAGIVTTSAASRVAAFGGAGPMFGTNPVAVAFGPEFCFDAATSQVCFGEIKERLRTCRPLEPGWAVDANGVGSTEPGASDALAPLGGYKGQGLAMVVTLLTAVLVGGPLDFEMPHIGTSPPGAGRGVAHLVLALDPAALGGAEDAGERMSALVEATRNSRRADPARPVLVPGDPQRHHERRQRTTGLELDDATAAMLDRLAAELGVLQ